MKNFTNEYLNGLIAATIVAFEENETIKEELDLRWTIVDKQNEKQIIASFCVEIEQIEIVNDSMTAPCFAEKSYFDSDWFLISQNESEKKFCNYVNEILTKINK